MSVTKIHQLVVGIRERWTTDPELGLVKRREEAVQPSTTHQITYQGAVYDILPDMTFELPPDVAEFFLRRHVLGWRPGPNPFYAEDPDVQPEVPYSTIPTPRSRTRKKVS